MVISETEFCTGIKTDIWKMVQGQVAQTPDISEAWLQEYAGKIQHNYVNILWDELNRIGHLNPFPEDMRPMLNQLQMVLVGPNNCGGYCCPTTWQQELHSAYSFYTNPQPPTIQPVNPVIPPTIIPITNPVTEISVSPWTQISKYAPLLIIGALAIVLLSKRKGKK